MHARDSRRDCAAARQILVQAYEMTALKSNPRWWPRARRGVQVNAIFDPYAVNERTRWSGELSAGGMLVFIDSFHRPGLKAHNKVMVIDQAVVITGSFNFTRAGGDAQRGEPASDSRPGRSGGLRKNFANHLAHSSAARRR